MRKAWISLRNIFLVVFGLGIIGFSAYQVVNGFEQKDTDLVGGEEIVVISENTPIASFPEDLPNNLNPEISKAPSEVVNDSAAFGGTLTPAISVAQTPDSQLESNTVQDTFLTQIDAAARPEIGEKIIPDRIVIPTIHLNAQVIVAGSRTVKVSDQTFDQWVAPNQFAAGWHGNSAYLGQKGNTVINGHHNEYGKVFGNLVNLLPGETIFVYSGEKVFPFIISNKLIVKEKNEDLETRLANSSWIQPSKDERLTLITCWPPETNTHRLIIVAVPYRTSPERVIG